MSGTGSLNAASSQIAAQQSQIASAVLGTKSVYQATGSQALTPTARDETTYLSPTNGVVIYGTAAAGWVAGTKIVFSLPKTATLIGKINLEITLSAGVSNPAYTPAVAANYNVCPQTAAVAAVGTPRAAYCNNIGDLIVEQTLLRYGSTVLQQYDSDMEVMIRKLRKNNVNIEGINAEVLGNLGPGGATEQVRIDAFYHGVTLVKPCEFLWFTQFQDRHWMPESLALEGALEFVLRGPGEVIYTSTGASAVITTFPFITNIQLRYQQITLSAAEKMNRLMLYKSPEGLVNLFQDNENQTNFQFTPTVAAGQNVVLNVPLSNFRMDMQEIIFMVRIAENTCANLIGGAVTTGQLQLWQGDRMESDRSTASLVTANAIGVLVPIVSYKLMAGGKDLQNLEPELYIRAMDRKQYHPDAELGSYVYHHAYAIYPEDSRNATGHISASVLGNLTLQINVLSMGTGVTFRVDVYDLSYNLIQVTSVYRFFVSFFSPAFSVTSRRHCQSVTINVICQMRPKHDRDEFARFCCGTTNNIVAPTSRYNRSPALMDTPNNRSGPTLPLRYSSTPLRPDAIVALSSTKCPSAIAAMHQNWRLQKFRNLT